MRANTACNSSYTDAQHQSETVSDIKWFANNTTRRYRIRPTADGHVIVRRAHYNMMLRTPVTSLQTNSSDDECLRRLWVQYAWPDTNAGEQLQLVKQIKKNEARVRA